MMCSSLRRLRLEAAGHGRSRHDLVDPKKYLAALAAKATIGVFDFAGRDEFLPRLEFVVLPAVIVQVLVENHDRARHQQVADMIEHGSRRGIQIAIDME